MKTQKFILWLLITLASIATVNANPDTDWDLVDPPQLILVADLAPNPGLEGLYWVDATASSSPLGMISFVDSQRMGTILTDFLIGATYAYALDLVPGTNAEVVIFEQVNTSGELSVYQYDGSSWNLIWNYQDLSHWGNHDLSLVDLKGDGQVPYLMAAGHYVNLHYAATGGILWSSANTTDGPGPDWELVNWTLADFDQDVAGDDELLIEFNNPSQQKNMLWMLNEGSATSATPLQSTAISMGPSRPNPMSSQTTVQFDLPDASVVKINVYDVRGRRVKTLTNSTMPAGAHTVSWDGTDNQGVRVAQGVYFYELKAGGSRQTRKMLVVR